MAAGTKAGIGLDALPPVRKAIGSGFESNTITLSCGKLTTGITVPQWSSILMLRNLKSPETHFQAAFRVQSPWSIRNPDGDNPNEEEILKPVCFVFDFAPTRALRQISEYGIGLSPNEPNPEDAVKDLGDSLSLTPRGGRDRAVIFGEHLLTEWIEEHCAVSWSERDDPRACEGDVIEALKAPLNIRPGAHPFRHVVKRARDVLTADCIALA